MHLDSKTAVNMFSVDQQLLELLDTASARDETFMPQSECKMNLFNKMLRELRLRTWVFDRDCDKSLALARKGIVRLFGVPVLIYGFLNNMIAYTVALWVARSTKDPQFRSSLKFLSGVFFVPVVSMVQVLLLYCYCRSFVLCGIYLVSIYLSGLIAYDLYVSTKRLVVLMRYRLGLQLKKSKYLALKQMHEELVGFVDARIF
jgi:hypothetical protein